MPDRFVNAKGELSVRILRSIVALALVWTIVVAAPLRGGAFAQQQEAESVVSGEDLNGALHDRLEQEDRARESVAGVLQNAEVRRIAERLGIDLRDAESAVQTLEGDELATAASHAEALDEALSGGAALHISLVAALLIIIIIVLLAD